METVGTKIQQLVKEMTLFQNEKQYRKRNIYDSININNFSDDEYNNILPMINSDNSSYIYSSPQSRISSGIPRSRLYSGSKLYSGKFSKESEIYDCNKYINLKKINRLASPSFLIEKFKIAGTNVLSPIRQKAKDIFLYLIIYFVISVRKRFQML